jgi:hypothetical protein
MRPQPDAGVSIESLAGCFAQYFLNGNADLMGPGAAF